LAQAPFGGVAGNWTEVDEMELRRLHSFAADECEALKKRRDGVASRPGRPFTPTLSHRVALYAVMQNLAK
jgi:hypothetical protein